MALQTEETYVKAHRGIKPHDAFQEVQVFLCYSNEGCCIEWGERGALAERRLGKQLDHEGATVS